MITLDNKKIFGYLKDKEDLVTEGRKVTAELEKVEHKIKVLESREKVITAKVKVDPKIEEAGNLLVKEMDEKMKELQKLGDRVEQIKLEAIPDEIKKAHHELLAEREKLERDRNKIALKVQKIKDRVIPLIQKETKPLLAKEYDDIETAKIKDDKIIVTTFNHLDEWKRNFRKK